MVKNGKLSKNKYGYLSVQLDSKPQLCGPSRAKCWKVWAGIRLTFMCSCVNRGEQGACSEGFCRGVLEIKRKFCANARRC